MQIQKINNSQYFNNYSFKNKSPDNAQDKEKKDYNTLKENITEAFLMVGSGYVCGDIIADMNTKNIPKSKPPAEKILFGIFAVGIIVTALQCIKAIKHYIQDKKNGIV